LPDSADLLTLSGLALRGSLEDSFALLLSHSDYTICQLYTTILGNSGREGGRGGGEGEGEVMPPHRNVGLFSCFIYTEAFYIKEYILRLPIESLVHLMKSGSVSQQ